MKSMIVSSLLVVSGELQRETHNDGQAMRCGPDLELTDKERVVAESGKQIPNPRSLYERAAPLDKVL